MTRGQYLTKRPLLGHALSHKPADTPPLLGRDLRSLFVVLGIEGSAFLGAFIFTAPWVAIAISVLRYRLWDIDLVVNRALVYGALTFALVLSYL